MGFCAVALLIAGFPPGCPTKKQTPKRVLWKVFSDAS